MIDRKITISNLETNIRWIEDIPCHQFPGWGNVTMSMRDALELLKEQESVIETLKSDLDETLAVLGKQPDIVRCNECKYWSAERINDFNKCRRWIKVGVKNFATMGDWFCADGERKGGAELGCEQNATTKTGTGTDSELEREGPVQSGAESPAERNHAERP